MPDKIRRRFTLFDGMVLIAATAVGIVGMRAVKDYFHQFAFAFVSVRDCLERINMLVLFDINMLVMFQLPLLLAWTAAILVLRLLRPRPARRHLTRQPGLIACLTVTAVAALAALSLGAALLVFSEWANPRRMLSDFASDAPEFLLVFAPVIQTGLLCSWMTLAVTGRWRAEPSWIDRAGRLIGIVWLTGFPFTAVFWLTELLN